MDEILTRNFCIIAHVDHGKTTLSDRLLEHTNTVEQRVLTDQHLDAMDLEKERGITIKSHPVTMHYRAKDGRTYKLNLMDTPGHVDFSYEVSRSLAACEGAVLLIDAAQGVEAQTVANAHLATGQDLKVIPVINKIDLPSANLDLCLQQLEDILFIPHDEAILASGKSGIGIQDILEAVVTRIPPPRWRDHNGTRALVFDSLYDSYRGVITYARVFSGALRAGDGMTLMSTGQKAEIKEVGIFTPKMVKIDMLGEGDVGYVVSNIKDTSDIKIGDTITQTRQPATEMLPGYKEVRPMVFCGLYPLESNDYEKLKAALGRLRLNDAAFQYQSESSLALGFGFRCGFLGLLHMEIIQERIRREHDVEIISTYPSVVYHVKAHGLPEIDVDNPVLLPDPGTIEYIAEPTIRASILIPNTCMGDILSLIMEKRGVIDHTDTLDANRVMLTAILPLNEILVDFNDRLKSVTHGYGSMDYELGEYKADDLVKMDILINGEPVDAFSSIVHRSKAEGKGRELCEKLAEIIPPQMFRVAIQAAIGGKIIARENVREMRKDVTAKCYGGDITRKRKLLEKQKEGKKKMKQIGKVSIPPDAFIQVLKN
ncbi:GTP-binding protein LepA [Ereboglobus sp. PH5-5]|uniref:translation elongation factor 4 n=1 Tax=unclassified Ereboglobus TaxID=2626932 RepID=UPI002405CA15|nr:MULTISPECIES: translation elongation factor 4 [unclassified Ereboglobus]MDF9826739.1 GTP-binding protein LepA [Ereboglobus sp. PH5-10]MDF9833360.1 GTP-binding protein LepA [Ereboglobus sp. PH5-5]